jgi:hypothetical protein
MQIKHIRMMRFQHPFTGVEATRVDALLPKEVKLKHGAKGKQVHAPVIDGDVQAAVNQLNAAIRAYGFSVDECAAPQMMPPPCMEPAPGLAADFEKAMA